MKRRLFNESDTILEFTSMAPRIRRFRRVNHEPDTIIDISQSAPEMRRFRTLNREPETISKLVESAPGMWSYPTHHDHCCIYRVPERLRRVNPAAYTPQLVLIGPLHHNLKSQPLESLGVTINAKLMGYLNMEEHKKIYLEAFKQRVEDKNLTDLFRRIIKEDEDKIRASYSESTSWIKSQDFVEMILLDSVFILEHMLRIDAYYKRPRTQNTEVDADYYEDLGDGTYYRGPRNERTGDLIVDNPCLHVTISEDLVLLENQLPYFILEKLFGPIVPTLSRGQTFRNLVLAYFEFRGKIKDYSTFKHFTDLLRCVRVDSLSSRKLSKSIFRCLVDLLILFLWALIQCVSKKKKELPREATYKSIKNMYNAEKLYSAGVKFKVVDNEFSMDVRFENGCLEIPCLWFDEYMEITLRNVMALEQCHYPFNAYVCNFVTFLDFLIDTDKDLDLLFEKGILNSWIGEQRSVAEMVNKLRLGIIENYSYYFEIASEVNAYYKSPINRSRAVLGRVYFGNLWTGTATVAAMLLLVMTLIQTVASIMQVKQN